MATYTIKKLRTTAQEAVRIAQQMPIPEVFNILPGFMNEITDCVVDEYSRDSMRVRYNIICAALWTAGRLHGVREERERRHRAKQ